jgi:hypothetical protein
MTARVTAKAKLEAAEAQVRELEAKLAAAAKELTKATAAIAALEQKLDKEPKPSAVPESLKDFTTPPDDPLKAQAELYRMLVLSAYDAATDTLLSAKARRQEIRTITAAAAKLFPESRRWQVEQLIKADREAIAKRASEKTAAKLEPRRTK